MSLNLSSLSRFQIQRFFQENNAVTQEECNKLARQIAGRPVTATPSQGGTSYTVEGGDVVVQFRAPNSPLDMDLLQDIEQAYADFAPRHQHYDNLAGGVIVYTMNNLGGACMYLARTELQRNDCYLLRFTLDDYARFFASAYYNTPDSMARPDRAQLFNTYSSLLDQLRRGLPRRFRSTLDALIPQLPILFDESWPLVPYHVDLLENNIHVDKITGRMLGICDWRGAKVGPFGISLGGLETMLGVRTTSGDFWRYHPNHEELERHFWDRLFYYLGGEGDVSDTDKERIRVARLAGLFLANGFQNGVAATEESEDLRFLGAVVLR